MINIKIIDMVGQIILEMYLVDSERSWDQVANLIDKYGKERVIVS